jgi:Ca2+-binding RTX toxin-like protein
MSRSRAAGTFDGYDGTVTDTIDPPTIFYIGLGFRNMDDFIGGAGNDRFTGVGLVSNWTIEENVAGTNTFQPDTGLYPGAEAFTFSNTETAVGGDLVDTFTINGTENVRLLGGTGDDSFIFAGVAALDVNVFGSPGVFDTAIDGGGGNDTLDFSAYDKGDGTGVFVNLDQSIATTINNAVAGGFTNIVNIIGSAFDDELIGDLQDNTIEGRAGNDIIEGIAGPGTDNLIGGTGDDFYRYNTAFASDNIVELAGVAEGIDFLSFAAVSNDMVVLVRLADVLIGTPIPADPRDPAGYTGIINITSQNLEGIQTGTGDDLFIFEDGAQLAGGTGRFDGNTGNDTIDYSLYISGVNVDLDAGNATGLALGGIVQSAGLSTIENVIGGSGNDTLSGDENVNTIVGNAGNDTIDARANDDTIVGGLGDDDITGGAGTDTLDETNNYANPYALVANTGDMTIDLETGTSNGADIGTDTITCDIENVTTAGGNDSLTGVQASPTSSMVGQAMTLWLPNQLGQRYRSRYRR